MKLDNKKVFVLEDMAERITWFRHACRYAAKLDIASDVGAAQKYLEQDDYDVIFLDHDLEPLHYQGYAEQAPGTGHDLAQWMVATDSQRQALVIIHSLNPAGCEALMATLAAWKPLRCPFTVLRMLAT